MLLIMNWGHFFFFLVNKLILSRVQEAIKVGGKAASFPFPSPRSARLRAVFFAKVRVQRLFT